MLLLDTPARQVKEPTLPHVMALSAAASRGFYSLVATRTNRTQQEGSRRSQSSNVPSFLLAPV